MTTFTSIHELVDFINHNHFSFAGHEIYFGCANVRTFDTITRTLDYLKSEKPAISADFDAEFMHMGEKVPTIITIGLDNHGITYTEHIKR